MSKRHAFAFFVPFALCFGAVVFWRGTGDDSATTAVELAGLSVPDSTTVEISLVYLGSSTCKWSNLPGIPDVIAEIADSLAAYAARNEYSFTTHGIARDIDPEAGIRHLKWVAPFAEVSAGRGWMGSGVLHYVFMEHPGPAATPQVVILRREVMIEHGERGTRNETVLRRLVSIDGMQNWLRLGAVLPSRGAAEQAWMAPG